MKTLNKNFKRNDAEKIKTYNLANKIDCRPPQSRETIPLNTFFLVSTKGELLEHLTGPIMSLSNNGLTFWMNGSLLHNHIAISCQGNFISRQIMALKRVLWSQNEHKYDATFLALNVFIECPFKGIYSRDWVGLRTILLDRQENEDENKKYKKLTRK